MKLATVVKRTPHAPVSDICESAGFTISHISNNIARSERQRQSCPTKECTPTAYAVTETTVKESSIGSIPTSGCARRQARLLPLGLNQRVWCIRGVWSPFLRGLTRSMG